MALYMHLGPFSKHVIGQIDRRLAELDDVHPAMVTGNNRTNEQALAVNS
jgi:hypothetical protein